MDDGQDYGLPQLGRNSRLRLLVILSFSIVFVLLAYTFLHESGHALVGLLFGGSLSSFSVRFWDLSAHAGIEGELAAAQRAVLSLAGITLPVLVWAAFVSLVPRKTNTVLDWMRFLGSLVVLNTLLAWIATPFLYLSGRAPADDSTAFLAFSGVQPLLVAAVSLIIYAGGWALLLSRVGGLQALIQRMRKDPMAPLSSGSRYALWAMALVMIVIIVVVGVIELYLSGSGPAGLPAGFSQVATVDLSTKSHADEAIYGFTLDSPAQVSFYIVLQNVDTGPVEIAMVGPGGTRSTFLKSGPDFNAGKATVHPRGLVLAPGSYEIHFTFPETRGQVSIYMKTEASGTPVGQAQPEAVETAFRLS